jgi:hypothetical protein
MTIAPESSYEPSEMTPSDSSRHVSGAWTTECGASVELGGPFLREGEARVVRCARDVRPAEEDGLLSRQEADEHGDVDAVDGQRFAADVARGFLERAGNLDP